MLFERQRLLISLLDAFAEPLAHTDFQKLLLLYTLECETKPSYDFVPYRFGGFSFTSYSDKRRLISNGLLDEDDHRWVLSKTGHLIAREQRPLTPSMTQFAERYARLRGNALIGETYRQHPYYATRSEILDRVLPEATTRARINAARPIKLSPGLLTIGYEGKTLECYLNQLLQASVTLLCDVRRNPLSRKYGFAKSTLAKACEGVGIRYEHLPQLGIASEERRELVTQADYDALFAIYRRDSLPHQHASLVTIRKWIEQENHRVALTCYEAAPCQCHRHCVAESLERLGVGSITPVHL